MGLVNGIWEYDEGDTASPTFSEMLNLLGDSVRDSLSGLEATIPSTKVLHGRASVPFSGTTGALAVTFIPPFSGTPHVVCQVLASTTWAVNGSAITASGFTINIFRASGSGTGNVSVDWVAVYG